MSGTAVMEQAGWAPVGETLFCRLSEKDPFTAQLNLQSSEILPIVLAREAEFVEEVVETLRQAVVTFKAGPLYSAYERLHARHAEVVAAIGEANQQAAALSADIDHALANDQDPAALQKELAACQGQLAGLQDRKARLATLVADAKAKAQAAYGPMLAAAYANLEAEAACEHEEAAGELSAAIAPLLDGVHRAQHRRNVRRKPLKEWPRAQVQHSMPEPG